jgi:hypothetical protein
MTIAFTTVGDTLDVSIIDSNFENFETLFKSSLVKADFAASAFSRFRVRRYVSGQIASVHSFANPFLGQKKNVDNYINSRFDITYREAIEDCGTVAVAAGRIESAGRHAYEMELLGRPGPSFYYSWQEDGRDSSVELAGVAGWPPTGWPYKRYPDEYCFSRWLTCPGASARVYVPHSCIAKIKAKVRGDTHFWSAIANTSLEQGAREGLRYAEYMRYGLIVDTNPMLYADEFVNSNVNIVDPVTGVQAPYKSWKVLEDITRNVAQRESIEMWAEVALVGGRYYNFSLKFRDAATHGFVDTTPGVETWMDGRWEYAAAGPPNLPVLNPLTPIPVVAFQYWSPPWVNLWESGAMSVEFVYGRDEAYVTDTGDAEFASKA